MDKDQQGESRIDLGLPPGLGHRGVGWGDGEHLPHAIVSPHCPSDTGAESAGDQGTGYRVPEAGICTSVRGVHLPSASGPQPLSPSGPLGSPPHDPAQPLPGEGEPSLILSSGLIGTIMGLGLQARE